MGALFVSEICDISGCFARGWLVQAQPVTFFLRPSLEVFQALGCLQFFLIIHALRTKFKYSSTTTAPYCVVLQVFDHVPGATSRNIWHGCFMRHVALAIRTVRLLRPEFSAPEWVDGRVSSCRPLAFGTAVGGSFFVVIRL